MTRWPVGSSVVLALSVLGAVLLAVHLHPILAVVPLMAPGLPAALMTWTHLRYGDSYAVSPRAVARDLRLPPR